MKDTAKRRAANRTGAGQPANQVDVDGANADGPFWGRWDCDHVRRRLQ